MKTKRVLIDAPLIDGQAGGIQQVVCGIAQGLSRLDTSCFEIRFCVYKGESEWLQPFLAEKFRLVEVAKQSTEIQSVNAFRNIKSFVRNRFGHLLGERSIRLQLEPEPVKQFNPDLIHFVHQNCFNTDRPFLFTPHDVQHEYFPEYFDKRTLMVRRNLYRRHAVNSAAVVCISESCQRDVVRYLGVRKEKCPIIYNAPLNGRLSSGHEARTAVADKFNLPVQFLFYPAKTYPHKNHRRLFDALYLLKSKGLDIPLICSGPLTAHYYDTLQPILDSRGLEPQIRFLGWLDETEVSALYDLATALVFPSEFEGFGLPLIEAMRAGLPVCCSKTTCIPEIVETAAVMFSPKDTHEMAEVIRKVWEDENLRRSLKEKGALRAEEFSWEKSAQQYLDLYASLLLKSA